MFKSLKQRWNNFILCIKYPVIIPRTMIKNRMCTNFFSHTWLDHFPKGWRKAFGTAPLHGAPPLSQCHNKHKTRSDVSERACSVS